MSVFGHMLASARGTLYSVVSGCASSTTTDDNGAGDIVETDGNGVEDENKGKEEDIEEEEEDTADSNGVGDDDGDAEADEALKQSR